MATSLPAALKPRKSPVQARSSASVEAMLDATLQVLVRDGKERLTTTRVAERAGVSVGTLYQYFPNKSSLLQATLRRHLEGVRDVVRMSMRELEGRAVEEICAGVARSFLQAKLHEPRESVALYEVSSDVQGTPIAQEVGESMRADMEALLRTGPQRIDDAALMSSMLLGAIAGVSRKLVESDSPERLLPEYQRDLEAMVRGYATWATGHVRSPLHAGSSPSRLVRLADQN